MKLSDLSWKDILLVVVAVVVLYVTAPYFGVNPYSVIIFMFGMVEWVTKYILPWIVLYWAIRLIKNLE
ncbi:hypothetical protein IMZ31_05455 [Pontibacillus sp. ALD_SL1]|uniref:hypothetical protein n=1 Tax=Pontibacillus sp. ALD_SL1 TaxID=2777185 RepID=UPI001A975917|nr:hypothetical protein [Pontibacillus sp. ALD_SL1]QST01017.1 hypothetical protein IMZ31_05455 [Pontibacillus sp. ALD_SL1]